MRSRSLLCTLAAFVLTSACGGGPGDAVAARPAPVPSTVGCGDAAQLRQQSADDRRLSAEQRSDQRKVSLGSRANFFALLATVAELKCKVTLAEAEGALGPALADARKAEAASSFYDSVYLWGEANFKVTQVVTLLIRQLGNTASK